MSRIHDCEEWCSKCHPLPAQRDVTEAMLEAFFDAPLCDEGKVDDAHEAESCRDCIRIGVRAALRAGWSA